MAGIATGVACIISAMFDLAWTTYRRFYRPELRRADNGPPRREGDENKVDRAADDDCSEYFTDLELQAQPYDWNWQPGTTRTPIGARPPRG